MPRHFDGPKSLRHISEFSFNNFLSNKCILKWALPCHALRDDDPASTLYLLTFLNIFSRSQLLTKYVIADPYYLRYKLKDALYIVRLISGQSCNYVFKALQNFA